MMVDSKRCKMSNGIAVGKTLYGFEIRERDERRNPDKPRDIKQLWSRSHEILRLDSLGYKGSEIAKILNISQQTVSKTLTSTLGQIKKSELRRARDDEYEELREEILKLTKKSLEVYNQILEKEDEPTKLKKDTADTVVLELSGLRVPTRVDSRMMHMNVTPEEIEEFKRRGIEAAKQSGQLVEVDNES